jgi:hypothetical protein
MIRSEPKDDSARGREGLIWMELELLDMEQTACLNAVALC